MITGAQSQDKLFLTAFGLDFPSALFLSAARNRRLVLAPPRNLKVAAAIHPPVFIRN